MAPPLPRPFLLPFLLLLSAHAHPLRSPDHHVTKSPAHIRARSSDADGGGHGAHQQQLLQQKQQQQMLQQQLQQLRQGGNSADRDDGKKELVRSVVRELLKAAGDAGGGGGGGGGGRGSSRSSVGGGDKLESRSPYPAETRAARDDAEAFLALEALVEKAARRRQQDRRGDDGDDDEEVEEIEEEEEHGARRLGVRRADGQAGRNATAAPTAAGPYPAETPAAQRNESRDFTEELLRALAQAREVRYPHRAGDGRPAGRARDPGIGQRQNDRGDADEDDEEEEEDEEDTGVEVDKRAAANPWAYLYGHAPRVYDDADGPDAWANGGPWPLGKSAASSPRSGRYRYPLAYAARGGNGVDDYYDDDDDDEEEEEGDSVIPPVPLQPPDEFEESAERESAAANSLGAYGGTRALQRLLLDYADGLSDAAISDDDDGPGSGPRFGGNGRFARPPFAAKPSRLSAFGAVGRPSAPRLVGLASRPYRRRGRPGGGDGNEIARSWGDRVEPAIAARLPASVAERLAGEWEREDGRRQLEKLLRAYLQLRLQDLDSEDLLSREADPRRRRRGDPTSGSGSQGSAVGAPRDPVG